MKRLIVIFSLLLTFAISKGQDPFMMVVASQGGAAAGGDFATVIVDGHTVAWFSSEYANITDAGSYRVSAWNDLSSNNNDLAAPSSGYRPLWTADGIYFDGERSMEKTIAGLEQPEFIYIVFLINTWVDNEYVFDGTTADGGLIYQKTTSGTLTAYAGSSSSQNALSEDTWCIARVLFNGASSKFIINTTSVTGNFGASDMAGFTLGGRGGGGNMSDITVKEIIIRNQDDGAGTEEATIYNYLKAKYSL
jgi:hypothetical protein